MQFANCSTITQIMKTNGNKYCNSLTRLSLGHYPHLRLSVLSLFFFCQLWVEICPNFLYSSSSTLVILARLLNGICLIHHLIPANL